MRAASHWRSAEDGLSYMPSACNPNIRTEHSCLSDQSVDSGQTFLSVNMYIRPRRPETHSRLGRRRCKIIEVQILSVKVRRFHIGFLIFSTPLQQVTIISRSILWWVSVFIGCAVTARDKPCVQDTKSTRIRFFNGEGKLRSRIPGQESSWRQTVLE